MYFYKYAKVTGEKMYDQPLYASDFPMEDRITMLESFFKRKASEPKSSTGTVLATGGGIGGVLGALLGLGAASGNKGLGVGIGAGVGAGLGALLGLLAKKVDDAEIDEAKRIISSSSLREETKYALMKELSNYDVAKNFAPKRNINYNYSVQ